MENRELAKKEPTTMTFEVKDGKLVRKVESRFPTRITEHPLDGTAITEDNYGGGKSKVSIHCHY